MTTATATRKPARKVRHAAKPKMSASQARTFEGGESLEAFMAVALSLAARNDADERFADCDCEPYASVFTFNRWIAQGSVVCKGEESIRHIAWIPTTQTRTEKDAATGEEVTRPVLRAKTVFLFCACQVKPLEPKP